ncbi:MAG: hypothetical protein ACP5QO_02705 [Clostridia bacterium]
MQDAPDADGLWIKTLQEDVDRLATRARTLVAGPEGSNLSRRGHAELVWALVELELAADHLEFAETYREPEIPPAPVQIHRVSHVRRHWAPGVRVFRALGTEASPKASPRASEKGGR